MSPELARSALGISPQEMCLAEYLVCMANATEQLSRKPTNHHLPHLSMESLLLEHGELFTKPARPFPLLGEMKACFENASNFAMARSDFIYVEGMALFNGVSIPIHHAWLVTTDGQTFDPTWAEPGDLYFGIPVAMDFLSKALDEFGCYGLLDEEIGIATLITGQERNFKATVRTAPGSGLFRQTAQSLRSYRNALNWIS